MNFTCALWTAKWDHEKVTELLCALVFLLQNGSQTCFMGFGGWNDTSTKLFQLEFLRNAEDMDTRSNQKGQIPEKVTKTLGAHKGINSDSEPGLTSNPCLLFLVSLCPLAGESRRHERCPCASTVTFRVRLCPVSFYALFLFYLYFSNFIEL